MTIQTSPDQTNSDAATRRKVRTVKTGAEETTAKGEKAARAGNAAISKAEQVIKKLSSAKGVTIPQMMEATGWQPHSVRGFLSGVVRKKLWHSLASEIGKDGVRRYRISAASTSPEA